MEPVKPVSGGRFGERLARSRSPGRFVSRAAQDLPGGSGYQVFPANPNAERVEGDPCFPDLRSIPGGVDGVVIVTWPQLTEEVVRQCPAAGVKRVWMHQSMVHGASVSEAAAEFCRANGITVIAGACPLMFGQTGDFGHKCMRWMMGLTRSLPE